MLARTQLLKGYYNQELNQNPDPHPPRGCPFNSLGPVWANMYSEPFSVTTPAGVGIKNPVRVKWRETLPSHEESAGRDIPMGQLVTKVLVSRVSPLPPCELWPCVDCGWMIVVRTPRQKNRGVWCGRTQFQ